MIKCNETFNFIAIFRSIQAIAFLYKLLLQSLLADLLLVADLHRCHVVVGKSTVIVGDRRSVEELFHCRHLERETAVIVRELLQVKL